MKKFNLFSETIVVDRQELSQALASNKEFGITLNGKIAYVPFERSDIFIYQGRVGSDTQSFDNKKSNQELLGKDYQVTEDDQQILIKAGDAWQNIINLNIHNCHYNDTSGSGIDEFGDQKIEDMGWMIIDFDVTYREIVEFLEENVDITLLCIENEEPYQFSGLGYFDDLEATQKIFYNFCQNIIKDKLANDPDYTFEYLDEDQLEAVKHFKAK